MEYKTANAATWVDAYVTSAVCPSCYAVLSVHALRTGDNRCPYCGERVRSDDYIPALDRIKSFERAEKISEQLKKQNPSAVKQ